ncbi:hypothetical protein [Falsiroseomonas ponticola]|jgi:hypothetical protein|uniref:hypothetical protein n=1 Tax=Falsiroseomonas ponticola TaxID=2786951 RepID=UPI0019346339|nr:hypothetical protein [Roseomonas ponticola]
MNGHWGVGRAIFGGNETLEVPCSVDIERTADSFHAYAVPEDVFLKPGDQVIVHGTTGRVEFGERYTFETSATVIRANAFQRFWTQWVAIFELTELYHCGFEPKEVA